MAVDHEHPLSHGYCWWGRKTPFSHWVGRSLPVGVTPWWARVPTSGLPLTMLHTSCPGLLPRARTPFRPYPWVVCWYEFQSVRLRKHLTVGLLARVQRSSPPFEVHLVWYTRACGTSPQAPPFRAGWVTEEGYRWAVTDPVVTGLMAVTAALAPPLDPRLLLPSCASWRRQHSPPVRTATCRTPSRPGGTGCRDVRAGSGTAHRSVRSALCADSSSARRGGTFAQHAIARPVPWGEDTERS